MNPTSTGSGVNRERSQFGKPLAAFQATQQQLSVLVNSMIDADQPDLFERLEEGLVRTAFDTCNRNQVQTARVLGISRNILRTHLKRFGLIGFEAGADIAAVGTVSGGHGELLQH